ncbi:MAG: hypothetical protein Q9162_001699 [Coniocarpon cinnabarinum]
MKLHELSIRLPLRVDTRAPWEAQSISSSPSPVRRAHAYVEEVSDEEGSSLESTPIETRRNSFFQNVMTEQQLLDHAAGIPLPGELGAGAGGVSVGHRIPSFVVPKNFAEVISGKLYRCSFPQMEHFSFLRCFGLKTILTLVNEGYSEAHCQFVARGNIQHYSISIKAHKKVGDKIDEDYMLSALQEVVNPANYPMLVHCNKGKHRTGCVMACFRKILGWSLEDVIAEYRQYAGVKARQLDIDYITSMDAQDLREKLEAKIKSPALPPEPFTDSPMSTTPVPSTRLRS